MGIHKIFFMLLFFSIYLMAHFRIITYLKRSFILIKDNLFFTKIFIFFMAFYGIISEILCRKIIFHNFNFLIIPGKIWLGIISISITIIIIFDIFKVLFKIFYIFKNIDINYKKFLKIFSKTAILTIFFISFFSIINNNKGPILKNLSIYNKNLQKQNITITQLTDLHFIPTTSKKTFDKIINLTNSTNPDIIVLTGDIFDFTDIKFIEKNFNLKKLKAKYGVFAVSGNHEYYIGIKNFYKIAKKLNIKVIDNNIVKISDLNINLIGLSDTNYVNEQNNKLKNLVSKINNNYSNILLVHRPNIFQFIKNKNILLQLSGHTHAGQIPPADIIEYLFFKYVYGLYKSSDKSSKLYLSSGTNYWGPPMRFLNKSEIVKINIKNINKKD